VNKSCGKFSRNWPRIPRGKGKIMEKKKPVAQSLELSTTGGVTSRLNITDGDKGGSHSNSCPQALKSQVMGLPTGQIEVRQGKHRRKKKHGTCKLNRGPVPLSSLSPALEDVGKINGEIKKPRPLHPHPAQLKTTLCPGGRKKRQCKHTSAQNPSPLGKGANGQTLSFLREVRKRGSEKRKEKYKMKENTFPITNRGKPSTTQERRDEH